MVTRSDAEKEALELAGIERKNVVLMTKFTPEPFAKEILKNIDIIYSKNLILWMHDKNSGTWSPNCEQYLKSIIRTKLLGEEQQKRNYIDEIVSHIKDTTYDRNFEMKTDPHYIAFENGVFNLYNGQFEDFKAEHYLTNKIPIEINENITECPNIDKFFEECVGKEYKNILYDLCAYCLFKEYPYQKLFFIYGPGRTGKSIFLKLLETFLSKDNYCSVEPQDIQKDKHATAQMEFKMANIVSDINYNALDNINQVKKITGEDTIKIRNMYQNPRNGRIFAKQIFSTNKLPVVKEKTRAWYRRVYTIQFSNIVPKEKMDRFIINKLKTKEELQGLGYICLQRLKKMKENNFTFEFDIDEYEMQKVYEQLSNPILMFIEQNCNKEKSSFVYQWEFKERLNTWLKANHFPPISSSEINEYMREHFTNSNRKSFNGDKTYRVWAGLSWKKMENRNQFNQFNHFNQVVKKVYRQSSFL